MKEASLALAVLADSATKLACSEQKIAKEDGETPAHYEISTLRSIEAAIYMVGSMVCERLDTLIKQGKN